MPETESLWVWFSLRNSVVKCGSPIVMDAVEALEAQLTCPVCLSLYSEPKVLLCHHEFCVGCLVKCVLRDEQRLLVVACPCCRCHTPLPAGGVASLQAAFKTNKLFNVHKKLVDDSNSNRCRQKDSSTPPQVQAPLSRELKTCPTHDGKALELWCQQCQELMCSHCGLVGEEHCGHRYELVSEVHRRCTEDIEAFLEPLQSQREAVKAALGHSDVCIRELQSEYKAVQLSLQESAKVLHDMVNRVVSDCMGKLDGMVDWQMDEIIPRRRPLQTSLAQLQDLLAFDQGVLDELPKLVRQKEVLRLKASQLCQDLQREALTQPPKASIKFCFDVDQFSEVLHKSLHVHMTDVCPAKCTVSGRSLTEALVGKQSLVILEAFTSEDQACKLPTEIRSSLVSEVTGGLTDVQVVRQAQACNKYIVTYHPEVKGFHLLSIVVEGQHVRGSPFTVKVQPKVLEYGPVLGIIKGVRDPVGVTLIWKGRVVVASSTLKYLSVYSCRGFFERMVGKKAYSKVVWNSTAFIVVSRKAPKAVFSLDLQGNEVALPLVTKHQDVADLAVDPVHDLVYVLYCMGGWQPAVLDQKCVEVFNYAQSEQHLAFGKIGTGKGQLSFPTGIAYHSKNGGRVFVSDTGNHRVQVFDALGKHLNMFGRKGGCLTSPSAIAANGSLIYVADGRRISMFSDEGCLIGSVCDFGPTVGTVSDLAVDDNGVLFVCDPVNSQIVLF